MGQGEDFEFDVFISYSSKDREWVRDWLLPRLKKAGLKVCIDSDFPIGPPIITNIMSAIDESRKTLLVMSPGWIESKWTSFEQLLLQTRGPVNRQKRMLPLLLSPCDLPESIGIFTHADFTDKGRWDDELKRVLKAIGTRKAPPEGPGEFRFGLRPLPPQPDFMHPYPLQENFTGRIPERKMLTQWLTGDERPVMACIAIGGMGKSALTWAWVQRDVLGRPLPGLPEEPSKVTQQCAVPEKERPAGVLWWSFYEAQASFPAFVAESLLYASDGKCDPKEIPSWQERVRVLLELLAQRRILLVLDGFERELRAYQGLAAAYQGDDVTQDPHQNYRACVHPLAGAFLQTAGSYALRGRILLTSRLFPRELEGMPGCRGEELIALAPADAVAFFRAEGVKGARAEVERACEPYGYHPLTLRLLAGMILRDPEKRGDISVAPEYQPVDELVPKQHHILQLSYDALDAPQREFLSRLAAFRAPMQYEAVKHLSQFKTGKELKDAVRELLDRGLLFFVEGQGQYDLHPIVRQYAYDRLGDKEGVHTSLRDYFDAVPSPEEEQLQRVEDLLPVVELYHHTVRAEQYDQAFELFRDRLNEPLYYRFGAYQTMIELLSALFLEGQPVTESGQAALPRLTEDADQSWALTALANAYGLSGQPRLAVPCFKKGNELDEKNDDEDNLVTGLENLAEAQLRIGSIEAAEQNLRRSLELSQEIEDEFSQAVEHQVMGLLLAYRGAFQESARELDAAMEGATKQQHVQGEGVTWASRAVRLLLMGRPERALDAARQARQKAHEREQMGLPNAYDLAQAERLQGAALVAMADEEESRRDELLSQAEGHLTNALARCRRINLVELEPDILLAWAKWHRLRGNADQALRDAEEALGIADRSEFRLKQADLHLFLARLALDQAGRPKARRHAEIARERALCDGPPHCYQPALEQAERLLEQLSGGI